jgi:hypothetical protein
MTRGDPAVTPRPSTISPATDLSHSPSPITLACSAPSGVRYGHTSAVAKVAERPLQAAVRRSTSSSHPLSLPRDCEHARRTLDTTAQDDEHGLRPYPSRVSQSHGRNSAAAAHGILPTARAGQISPSTQSLRRGSGAGCPGPGRRRARARGHACGRGSGRSARAATSLKAEKSRDTGKRNRRFVPNVDSSTPYSIIRVPRQGPDGALPRSRGRTIERLSAASVTAVLHWYTGAVKHIPAALDAALWFSRVRLPL